MQDQPLALLNSRRLEEFLTELVNLRREPAPFTRFLRRFGEEFGLFNLRLFQAVANTSYATDRIDYKKLLADKYTDDQKEQLIRTLGWDKIKESERIDQKLLYNPSNAGEVKEVIDKIALPYFTDMFRALWVEPDAQTRQWGWAIFRTDLARSGHSGEPHLSLRDNDGGWIRIPPPPEALPIEQAFEYLLKHHKRARYCASPDCPAPYFFAKRHTQRYCSEMCGQNGERETKRRWWAEHGTAWRKERKHTATTASKKLGKATKKGRKGK